VGALEVTQGDEVLSCAIITTEANESSKGVYHRTPVILKDDVEAAWLDPKTEKPEKLLPLLMQFPSEQMFPVSRQVDSPVVDRVSNIVPI
jgi:putative SOS response-associated peptidase YedK